MPIPSVSPLNLALLKFMLQNRMTGGIEKPQMGGFPISQQPPPLTGFPVGGQQLPTTGFPARQIPPSSTGFPVRNVRPYSTGFPIDWERIKESSKPVTIKGEGKLIEEAKKYKSEEEFMAKIQGSATQYEKYTPEYRKGAIEGYKNISELGIDPEQEVTIYRGIDDITGKVKKKINDGDFVTTDYESALAYTGGSKGVVQKKVKAKDLYVSESDDFKEEPFYTGAEYIYTSKGYSPLTKSQLTDIWKKAHRSSTSYNTRRP